MTTANDTGDDARITLTPDQAAGLRHFIGWTLNRHASVLENAAVDVLAHRKPESADELEDATRFVAVSVRVLDQIGWNPDDGGDLLLDEVTVAMLEWARKDALDALGEIADGRYDAWEPHEVRAHAELIDLVDVVTDQPHEGADERVELLLAGGRA